MAKDFHVELSTGPCWVMVEDYLGLAAEERTIYVAPKAMKTKEYLDTIVHETAHLTMPGLPEADIVRLGKDIAEVLWKRGYRLTKP